ncbi:uncharacterized protein QC761_0025930 [Podospora bellae-mahoneyi]|uniref:Uncharacterized protein n=1 Tax=Podospora bellae-mahoneyi TaxID=2093777 RepID=A0ABR0FUG0_9PEZI|nr:hypothetical protein QC761_0025930 [Podospora bellae-mahoneyi]
MGIPPRTKISSLETLPGSPQPAQNHCWQLFGSGLENEPHGSYMLSASVCRRPVASISHLFQDQSDLGLRALASSMGDEAVELSVPPRRQSFSMWIETLYA